MSQLRFKVLGMPYGVDRQGQTFDAHTELGDYDRVPVHYLHGWTAEGVKRIGWAYKAESDTRGQWFTVKLDDSQLSRRILAAAQQGKARASSDSIAHLVRPQGIVGKAGYVSHWPIAALSLMHEADFDKAVNPNAYALPDDPGEFRAALALAEKLNADSAAKADAMQRLIDDAVVRAVAPIREAEQLQANFAAQFASEAEHAARVRGSTRR